jgi:hypothetical protein
MPPSGAIRGELVLVPKCQTDLKDDRGQALSTSLRTRGKTSDDFARLNRPFGQSALYDFFFFFFAGTFAPLRRASERPIAIACFRLLTFLPERPDFRVPRFFSCIARFTFCEALELYFLLDDGLDGICKFPFSLRSESLQTEQTMCREIPYYAITRRRLCQEQSFAKRVTVDAGSIFALCADCYG